jgi:hypothetical protein
MILQTMQSTEAVQYALKFLLTPQNAVNFAAALPKRALINSHLYVKYAEYANMARSTQNMAAKKNAEYYGKYT